MTRTLPKGWSRVNNEDVFSLVKGAVIKDISSEPAKNRVPYLLIETFDGAAPVYVPVDKAVPCAQNDPVIVMDGSRSGLVLRGKDGALGSTLAAARPLPSTELSKDFLYYYLTSLYRILNIGKTAGAVPHVDRQFLMSLPIFLPPLAEQEKIAEILGSVDAAIVATRRVIDQTRSLKRAMMQQLLTRGIPGHHKRFKDSPLGKIPEGWEIAKIGELLREPIRNGFSPNCSDQYTGHWMLGLGSVTHNGFVTDAIKPVPVDDVRVLNSLLVTNDLLVSRSNTRDRVGLAGIYKGIPENCSYPDLLMRIRLDETRCLPEWLEFLLLSPYGRRYFEQEARGTSGSMVKIDRKILHKFPVALPTLNEQRDILESINVLQKRIDCEQQKIAGLQNIMRGLVNALLSGAIRVSAQPVKLKATLSGSRRAKR